MDERSFGGGNVQPAPFVAKTYEMVSDPTTDALIQWGRGNNSFLVVDSSLFSQLLLPSYFKHCNFSSFVRQLNTYGFRKVDPDRWEFAHEKFLKGQAHLLPLIMRRQRRDDSTGEKGEAAGTEDEEDDQLLMKEVGWLRRDQRVIEDRLQGLSRRLQVTERRPKQVISFLSKVAEDPEFLTSLIVSKKEKQSGEKKRRLLVSPPPPPIVSQIEEKPVVADAFGFRDAVQGVVPGGRSQGLFLPEIGIQPAASPATVSTFPFSLLGEGFF